MTASSETQTLTRPNALCHIVYQTTAENYEKLVNWYCTFTGGHVVHGSPRISFLTYDHEHHRVAIVINPKATPRPDTGLSQVGVNHVAFGLERYEDLADSYEQKKALGILPVWCVDHGLSTSMYYQDPDGNRNELQVDNFETKEEAVAFMESAAFAENPVGVDYDPEEFVARVRRGDYKRRSIAVNPTEG